MTEDLRTTSAVLAGDDLGTLITELSRDGRTVIGPTVRDGAIVLAEVTCGEDLPYGWGVDLEAGRYRLRARDDRAVFAHSAGPQSWKKYLHPQRERQWSADLGHDGVMVMTEETAAPPSYAFLGVRPCDQRAIAVQDRVLSGGEHVDSRYRARREKVFMVVVECTEPGATCFCVSMDAGPAAGSGYDLALTEVLDDEGHRFLLRAGSEEGERILARLPCRPAGGQDVTAARDAVAAAATRMGRSMPETDLRVLMRETLHAERWNDVTSRCLTCGNCTMACPTCFCTSVEDVSDLGGEHAERWRRWESCFDVAFTHLQAGPVRASPTSRYRQWLTHKVGTWHDQFGSSGCVGCGRCIVWCPTGIDITEEVHALAAERAATTDGGTSR